MREKKEPEQKEHKQVMITPDLLATDGSKRRWERFIERVREKDYKSGGVRHLNRVELEPADPPEPAVTITTGYAVDETGTYDVLIVSSNGNVLSVDRAIPKLEDAEKEAKEWAELLGIEYTGLITIEKPKPTEVSQTGEGAQER